MDGYGEADMVAQNENLIPDEPFEEIPEDECIFKGLNLRQERAIVALLQEATIGRAAKVAEVGERTLHYWMRQPVFSQAFRKARRDAFSQAVSMTQHYAPLAVNTLAKIMADPDAPQHARVTAATTILKFGREGIELDDLAARIEALEDAAERVVNRR